MKRLIFTIDPLGRATCDAKGFEGGECVTASAGILKALSDGKGKDVVIETADMLVVPVTGEQQQLMEGY